MQLQLALEPQGLGGINWPDIEQHEQEMGHQIDWAPYERPIMLSAVGYPRADTLVPYSTKKIAADVIVRQSDCRNQRCRIGK